MQPSSSTPTYPDSQLPFVDLPEEDKLVVSLGHEDVVTLNDEIISTGSLDIRGCQLPAAEDYSDAQLLALGEKLAQELVSRKEDGPSEGGIKFETTVGAYKPALVTAAARILAVEVNVFANPGGRDTRRLAGTLGTVLGCLPLNASTTKVVVARAEFNDTENDFDNRHITVTLFVNKRTGRAVVLYMRQGDM